MASTIDYRLKPLIERFGDRHISEIRTADIEDFVADMKTPRVVNGIDGERFHILVVVALGGEDRVVPEQGDGQDPRPGNCPVGPVRRSTRERGREGGSFKFLSRSAPPALRRRTGSRPLKLRKCLIQLWVGVWYRYGDSNPGPVAENHVS